jgi:hypothetical protein
MASRTLFSERLGFVLRVGAFVHVREDKVPDRGKLKVHQLTKFWPETEEFGGSYWEQQPRLDGSSLREHDFDDGDHPVVKLIPEIVHITEIHLAMDIPRKSRRIPAFPYASPHPLHNTGGWVSPGVRDAACPCFGLGWSCVTCVGLRGFAGTHMTPHYLGTRPCW